MSTNTLQLYSLQLGLVLPYYNLLKEGTSSTGPVMYECHFNGKVNIQTNASKRKARAACASAILNLLGLTLADLKQKW
jgi:dsRNA-specific ribonuclease